jgi:hypothetical protein
VAIELLLAGTRFGVEDPKSYPHGTRDATGPCIDVVRASQVLPVRMIGVAVVNLDFEGVDHTFADRREDFPSFWSVYETPPRFEGTIVIMSIAPPSTAARSSLCAARAAHTRLYRYLNPLSGMPRLRRDRCRTSPQRSPSHAS